ncbi:ABC transporter permease [Polyangium spumosum]|uniref:MlaE family ABC transporter permease n=1 Tax=Polyangium spumosum TaxID=889282 RepID=UPI0030845CC8
MSTPSKKLPALPEPPFWVKLAQRGSNFLVHLGQLGRMTGETFAAMFKRPFEFQSTLYQMEQLGIRSLGIACATALFTGMVMAVQFAFGLQKFGGMEYTGRVIGLSFSRELAPTLTAVIVGGRIGSGIAAEVGSMAVTEQIDAIRALGADPMKKLVVPRLISCVIVMPVLGALALVIGFSGAMMICDWQFGIPWGFFLRSALGSMHFRDFWMGLMKCPFFGAIIALVGCHFGMITRGGTEGVGQSTTRAVVGVSISILVADFVLTKLGFIIFG